MRVYVPPEDECPQGGDHQVVDGTCKKCGTTGL